eukprot:gene54-4304_t
MFSTSKSCGIQPKVTYKQSTTRIYPECKFYQPEENPVKNNSTIDVVIQLRGVVPQRFQESGIKGLFLVCDTPGLSQAMLKKFGGDNFVKLSLENINLFIKKEYGSLVKIGRIAMGSFSAGYAPIQKHLNSQRIDLDSVVIIDGIHYGPAGKPDPVQHQPFVDFAKKAVSSGKLMVISHSSIVPPYSSSTDAANYIMKNVNVSRNSASLNEYYVFKNRFGRVIQPQTEGRKNGFHVEGYKGNTANSHIEQIDHLSNLFNFFIARRWNC